jgi:hypothetical protein
MGRVPLNSSLRKLTIVSQGFRVPSSISLLVFDVFLAIVGWPPATPPWARSLGLRGVRPIELATIEKMVPHHAPRQQK